MYIFKDAVQKNVITRELMMVKDKEDNKNYATEVIENIIKRMETDLKTPEQKLVEQDQEIEPLSPHDQMFFIAKGKCKVVIRDKFEDRYEEKIVNVLGPGDHFGEIAMLYSCPRSATVVSENYITCSKISRQKYNELLTYYPSFNNKIREHIKYYCDPLKIFLEISINQIDFFKNLGKLIKNEIIFNLRVLNLDKGKYLFKKG